MKGSQQEVHEITQCHHLMLDHWIAVISECMLITIISSCYINKPFSKGFTNVQHGMQCIYIKYPIGQEMENAELS